MTAGGFPAWRLDLTSSSKLAGNAVGHAGDGAVPLLCACSKAHSAVAGMGTSRGGPTLLALMPSWCDRAEGGRVPPVGEDTASVPGVGLHLQLHCFWLLPWVAGGAHPGCSLHTETATVSRQPHSTSVGCLL